MEVTFTAASGFMQRSGPLRFHPDSDLGDFSLTFAPQSGGDLELEYNGTPGIIDPDTMVSLDGGATFQSFSVSSIGTVSASMNENFFGKFAEFDASNPPQYAVIDVGGTEYVFFKEFPDTTGDMTGNVFVVDEGGPIFVCFVAGTMIATLRGERPIETLEAGDEVLTRDNGVVKLKWIGRSKVPTGPTTAPVVFEPGALGQNMPMRRLRVSPMHRMLVKSPDADMLFGASEVLVPAKHLINGTTIRRDTETAEVTYVHLLFDYHEIVFSDGAPSESFHPGAWGMSVLEKEMQAEILALFPELAEDMAAYGVAARPSLKAHEARLLAEYMDA